MSKKPVEKKKVETTGHKWDGIEEFNNPLPRWWVWVFYLTIVWGIWYSIAYPAWPMIKGATAGYLGWSTRGDVAEEIQRFKDMNSALETELASADLTTLERGSELHNYAIQSGGATFATFCSQCHGAGANGITEGSGYPNLLDNDWLWGGSIDEIATTIRHGIRNDIDDDARYSEMPAFGEMLSEEEIASVVQHVRAISGQDHDATLATAGAGVFLDNCAACHGDEGTGDVFQGAPNVTDAIWLYGNSREQIQRQILAPRMGMMPKWGDRLDPATIKMLAAYVHSLGGGEDFVEVAAEPVAETDEQR